MHEIKRSRRLGYSLVMASMVLIANGNAGAARIEDKSLDWPGQTLFETKCYGKRSNYGPFDYTNRTRGDLGLVEYRHFTPEIAQLVRGKTGQIYDDIDYTLRAYPNHHRALWSMARYYLRKFRAKGEETMARSARERADPVPPAECYFLRAKAFAPEDMMVSAVYGIYLHRRGRYQEALSEYSKAEKAFPNNSELAYNIGLLQVDLDNLDKAAEYSDRAKKLGYPLTGLSQKIKRKRAQSE